MNAIFSRFVIAVHLMVLLPLMQANAQTSIRAFKVYNGETYIGTLKAVKTQTGNRIDYNLTTDTRFRLLLSFHVTETIVETFINNSMIASVHTRIINEKVKAVDKAIWNQNSYLITENNENPVNESEKIINSVCSIYFSEPVNISKVYSQSYRKILPFSCTGPHQYTLFLPNGNRSVYQYQNGACTGMTAYTGWTTLHFVYETPLASIPENSGK